ncbi:hypothetical protein J6Q66_04770 [bacterium]|nr:hypothetical protein [bacterium]
MKNQILKYYSFFIFLIFLFLGIQKPCFSYETAIIDFPEKEGWELVFSKKNEKETIVQFLPSGEDRNNWTRTVVFHSYKDAYEKNFSAKQYQQKLISSVYRKNKSLKVKTLKNNEDDAISIWCVEKNEKMPAQCEILRTTQGYETIISMHYINKNIKKLSNIEKNWIKIIKKVRTYYSYYRMDRLLNREIQFEF